MMRRAGCIGLISGVLLLGGCQGTGESINLNVHSLQSSVQDAQENVRVAVQPFQDLRPEKNRVGAHAHMWGGATSFTAWDGKVGEGMAETAVEYFQQRGWDAEIADPTSQPADILLVGKIKDFSAHAESRFWSTKLEVNLLIHFEAQNRRDGSIAKITLGASGSDTNVFFESHDMEDLTNDVLKDTFMQFLENTQIKGRAITIRTLS